MDSPNVVRGHLPRHSLVPNGTKETKGGRITIRAHLHRIRHKVFRHRLHIHTGIPLSKHLNLHSKGDRKHIFPHRRNPLMRERTFRTNDIFRHRHVTRTPIHRVRHQGSLSNIRRGASRTKGVIRRRPFPSTRNTSTHRYRTPQGVTFQDRKVRSPKQDIVIVPRVRTTPFDRVPLLIHNCTRLNSPRVHEVASFSNVFRNGTTLLRTRVCVLIHIFGRR